MSSFFFHIFFREKFVCKASNKIKTLEGMRAKSCLYMNQGLGNRREYEPRVCVCDDDASSATGGKAVWPSLGVTLHVGDSAFAVSPSWNAYRLTADGLR